MQGDLWKGEKGMSLVDMLFQGPVGIADLNHEQYGEAAVMRRQGLVLIDGEEIRLTEKGMLSVVTQALQSLERKGLVVNFADGSMATPEGKMIAKGSGPTM